MRLVLTAVFLGFWALYALTAQQDANWQDSGIRQHRILSADYVGADGIALAHPFYIGMARAFVQACPFGQPLFRLNLFSGLGMSLALVCLTWLVRRLTGNWLAAVGSALLLGLAHMPWWLATITEVYTWSLAAILFELMLLHSLLAAPQPRKLIALALVSGLGLSIHNFALLALPVYLTVAFLLVRGGQLPWRALAWSGLAYLAGSAPFLALVVADVMARQNIAASVSSALFGDAYMRQVLGLSSIAPRLTTGNLCLFLLNFASPCWVPALAGGWMARHWMPAHFRNCLLALTAIHAVFFLRYFVGDQALFALPVLGLLAIWSGLGLAWLLERGAGKRVQWIAILLAGLLAAPAVYQSLWSVVTMGDLAPMRARVLPFRDENRYWILPWKCDEHSAQRFASSVLAQVEPDAVVYADLTAIGPLLATTAASHEPVRIRLFSPFHAPLPDLAKLARKADRPFYVVSPAPGYVPDSLRTGAFAFSKTGVLYRVQATH